MGWWNSLAGGRPERSPDGNGRPGRFRDAGAVPGDTQAAIAELSQVVRDNPDAVEIYLALGNLYRSHGEIERAVQIRQNLIVRPGLGKDIQAKTWFELGRDYKRGGFLDRAQNAFEQARKLGGDNEAIVAEMARLTADSGDHEQAARHYARLGNPVAEAHHLVRLATAHFADGRQAQGYKWLRKALKAHAGSLEAWLELMHQAMLEDNWRELGHHLARGLDSVRPDQRFVLLEGLLDAAKVRELGPGAATHVDKPFQYHPPKALTAVALPLLERHDDDLLLQFYAAWMVCGDDPEAARRWLERTLVLNPGFWPARLELLALDTQGQQLGESFRTQLDFFVQRARELKRFVCRRCGLKREQVFFVCPRCKSWHSIKYRTVLNE
jgi:lipopolysaccharide biosynthesis regulator YciM